MKCHLRAAREARGLTKSALARQVGVSRQTVYLIERDTGYRPNLVLMTRLADAFGMRVEDLFEVEAHDPIAASVPLRRTA